MSHLKKRILVPVTGQGSITHIIRTGLLDELSRFCTPVIALLWQQDDLVEELKYNGYEVAFIPAYSVCEDYASLRSKINLWYFNFRVKTPSVGIQQKYLSQYRKTPWQATLKKQLRETFYKSRFGAQPTYISTLLQQERELMSRQEVFGQYKTWLASLQITGLFTVTPFLPEIDLMARILKQSGLPLICSIHSFDNITKRGWQSVLFDHYIVWNKYNKAELQRIHKELLPADHITIAGAPQFDFHQNPHFTWSREEWLQRLGLPCNKKIILYSGGPVSLLPDEPQYLRALKEAFEQKSITHDCIILFRCHPLDKVERWKDYVGESNHIVYDSAPNGSVKNDQVNVRQEDIIKLMSTLRHTDVHINVVSTMCVDGSAFGKPQLGPYYDDINPYRQHLFRQMYFQEHYRPIMSSKVVNLAHNRSEFISLVTGMLEVPADYTESCNKCVEEIITYADGKSALRAAAAIEQFFEV